ncbi:unnamed protein product [Zymoseptoria tritici ST99CH_1E4]|uniref:Uncharacterized protein n=1 Tax=Zymoseptoria tritici ST99CH_1E4 TaxID=1276532 RepID=A0A2H1GPX1_ZYMTR|nr:unnamed protein product [Zymoseptoria tritici ST99CH_1E4]
MPNLDTITGSMASGQATANVHDLLDLSRVPIVDTRYQAHKDFIEGIWTETTKVVIAKLPPIVYERVLHMWAGVQANGSLDCRQVCYSAVSSSQAIAFIMSESNTEPSSMTVFRARVAPFRLFALQGPPDSLDNWHQAHGEYPDEPLEEVMTITLKELVPTASEALIRATCKIWTAMELDASAEDEASY